MAVHWVDIGAFVRGVAVELLRSVASVITVSDGAPISAGAEELSIMYWSLVAMSTSS